MKKKRGNLLTIPSYILNQEQNTKKRELPQEQEYQSKLICNDSIKCQQEKNNVKTIIDENGDDCQKETEFLNILNNNDKYNDNKDITERNKRECLEREKRLFQEITVNKCCLKHEKKDILKSLLIIADMKKKR